VDARGVGSVVNYVSCNLRGNGLGPVTGEEGKGGTTRVENGATGLAFGSIFSLNFAFSGGGAMRVLGPGSTLVVKNSVLNTNTASRSGGALHIQNAEATSGANKIFIFITACNFLGNLSYDRSGGALWSNRNAQIQIVDTTFFVNEAAQQGGALFIGGDSLLLSERNVFESNTVLAAPGDPTNLGGNHIFIHNANNYDDCSKDTFADPASQDPNAIVTSSGSFLCPLS
jgi:hypothetical protein